jgi:hypothetical protein
VCLLHAHSAIIVAVGLALAALALMLGTYYPYMMLTVNFYHVIRGAGITIDIKVLTFIGAAIAAHNATTTDSISTLGASRIDDKPIANIHLIIGD